MTRHRSFKDLVRARMARTGERYTTARAALLAARERDVLATFDDQVRDRTGLGWEEWFDLLDDAGMRERPHREVARWLAAERGLDPLAWGVQAVVGSYDRARRGRQVGQREDGFAVSVQRTLDVTAAQALAPVLAPHLRASWVGDLELRVRPGTHVRVVRFDVVGAPSRVHVSVDGRDEHRCTVTVEQVRLPDAQAADAARTAWRGRLDALRALTAGGAR